MLTQRSRYALRAMLFLAEQPAGGPPVPMNRIAKEANVPRKFLELILADLREAGFLSSHRGKMGGYYLARAPHLISLGEIIRVIEGPLALVPCVSRTAYRSCGDCHDEATCAIRRAFARVRDETARILDGTSLATAAAEELAAA
jgi:Rrf2 family protein